MLCGPVNRIERFWKASGSLKVLKYNKFFFKLVRQDEQIKKSIVELIICDIFLFLCLWFTESSGGVLESLTLPNRSHPFIYLDHHAKFSNITSIINLI